MPEYISLGSVLKQKNVPKDLVEAYKWFSLAVSRGGLVQNSNAQLSVANQMTPQQITEAERRAADFFCQMGILLKMQAGNH